MRRETQNVLLVLLGGALMKIALDGTYLRYVKPSLQPFLIATGVVIVALALLAIVRDLRAGGPAGKDDDHDHSSRSPWMLLLPVFAIFLIAPPALGAASVDTSTTRSVAATSSATQPFAPLPPGRAPMLRMVDFVQRAVFDTEGGLDGREVSLTGFVLPVEDGGVQLARLTISCCAADSLSVRVDLDGDAEAELGVLVADTWLVVRGTLQPGTATPENGYVPTLQVTGFTPAAVPEDPYEY